VEYVLRTLHRRRIPREFHDGYVIVILSEPGTQMYEGIWQNFSKWCIDIDSYLRTSRYANTKCDKAVMFSYSNQYDDDSHRVGNQKKRPIS
jgi:hypothetical protein